MRNGNISFGLFLAFVAGTVVGDLDYNEAWWLILLVWVVAIAIDLLAFSRVERGVKEEISKARQNDLLRKAGLK